MAKYAKEFYEQMLEACGLDTSLTGMERLHNIRLVNLSAELSLAEKDTLSRLWENGPIPVEEITTAVGNVRLSSLGLAESVVLQKKGGSPVLALTVNGVQVCRMLEYRKEHQIPDPEVHADNLPLKTGGGLPAQVWIHVPTAQVENVKAQHYPMATIVRSRQELNSCTDPIVILSGKSLSASFYNWELESGELVTPFLGYYRVGQTKDGGVWLRCFDGPTGGKFDLTEWVTRTLQRNPKSDSLESELQALKTAMVKPIPADKQTARLVKWGVLEETAGMCSTTDLGRKVVSVVCR